MFPLFDTHGDGHLDSESVERAVDVVVLPVAVASERCYLAAARPALDKKAAAVMPATMKHALWDVLEVPVKRRCSFAWAEDRKQVGGVLSWIGELIFPFSSTPAYPLIFRRYRRDIRKSTCFLTSLSARSIVDSVRSYEERFGTFMYVNSEKACLKRTLLFVRFGEGSACA